DEFPQWLGADRLVFMSSRVQRGLMTIRVDLNTGKAIGAPQRLTVEPAWQMFAGSADGKWVVYSAGANGKTELRRIPSSGGPARTLATVQNGVFNSPHFTSDGSAIEYVESHRLASGLMRIPVSGGTPTVIVPVGGYPEGFLVPANDLLLRGRF